MKILLTDGSHKNTLAILRYLGKLKNEIHILHHKKSAPAYSKYCKKLIITPQIYESKEYYQFILELVKTVKYDILIPVGVLPVKILSKNLEEIRKYVPVEIPEYEKVQIALNKTRTFKLAEENQIPCPATIYPNSKEDALKMVDKLHFPVIVKSSDESKHKFPTLYILNKEELSVQLSKLEMKYPKIKANYPLIQEKISGKAYGFFAVYQDGECKKIFMHERVRENPVSGGASTCAKSIYDKDLLIAGKKILDILQWHGQAMVEFKKDEKDNTYKLIEINPKFWGSLELSLAAGMNFPEFLCQIAIGEKLSYSEEYKRNIIFQWIVSSNGELYRLLKKPSDIFLVLRDIFRFNSTSDIWFTDFKPVVIEFLYFIAYIKNMIFK